MHEFRTVNFGILLIFFVFSLNGLSNFYSLDLLSESTFAFVELLKSTISLLVFFLDMFHHVKKILIEVVLLLLLGASFQHAFFIERSCQSFQKFSQILHWLASYACSHSIF